MATYRVKRDAGDSVPVPRLVFSRLQQSPEDAVRAALYLLDGGAADSASLARALALKSPAKAESLLTFWLGAGLLELTQDAPAESAPAEVRREHLTTPEVAVAAAGDKAIAQLVQECQRLMGGVITQADTNILVSMYVSDGMPVEMILLGVAHFAAQGKRSARYIERALLGWQRDGIDSGEAAARYLEQMEQRAAHEAYVAGLLNTPDAKFTKGDRMLIAEWYEGMAFGDEMVAEAAAWAGAKQSVRYLNGILRTWYTKGFRTVRDVLAESAGTMRNVQTSNPEARDILAGGARRVPVFPTVKEEGGA